MTVCLTGDVHHMSLKTRDHPYLSRTELEAAVEYATLAGQYDVPVTLFVTGKAVIEEPAQFQRLVAMEHVEVGGHNYWAFETPVHLAWRAMAKGTGGRIGSWNGPWPFQQWEISRTLSTLSQHGADVHSWRDHAYRYDSHTKRLLRKEGITHFSDEVGPDKQVRRVDGLTTVPINTPPDHEHVYHGFRTPDFVAEDGFSGPFGAESHEPDEWADWVRDTIRKHTDEGTIATVLAHPSCMDIADGLDTFEKLLSAVADQYDCIKLAAV